MTRKKRAIVTGGSSGLGAEIARELMVVAGYQTVIDWSKEKGVNLQSVNSVRSAAQQIPEKGGVDVLINCAGVNYIDWFEKLPYSEWDRLMDINARSLWLTTKELIDAEALNPAGATVVNIVSNASHMPMTHSCFYNASKGAAHIMTLQMARELKKTHNLTVFGVSPNKLKGTGMSAYIEKRVCELRGWTPEEAENYQLTALPAGEETDPAAVAEFIGFLLSSKERHKYLHGCILPYGA